jgi:hypothetical protein
MTNDNVKTIICNGMMTKAAEMSTGRITSHDVFLLRSSNIRNNIELSKAKSIGNDSIVSEGENGDTK